MADSFTSEIRNATLRKRLADGAAKQKEAAAVTEKEAAEKQPE